MNLCGGDRRRIDILQGRNRLKGAQNNILRLNGSSLVSLNEISIPLFCRFVNAFDENRENTLQFSHKNGCVKSGNDV